MLSPDARLTPNRDEVAAKVIDGEAIMMNLVNASYYSMDGAGADVWELIEQGRSLEEVIDWVTSSFDVEEETARSDVEALYAELLEEGLVLIGRSDSVSEPTDMVPSDPRPYETPTLVKYTDMADLLALDPPMPGLTENPWVDNADR